MKSDTPIRLRPWGHLVLMVIFVLTTTAFLYDTMNQSMDLENIIVILPVSLLVLILCGLKLLDMARTWPPSVDRQGLDVEQMIKVQRQQQINRKIILYIVLLTLYVLGLLLFYFDVSTFLFITLALWIQGDRRYVFGTAYALALSLGLTWGLRQMVPYPFDALFF